MADETWTIKRCLAWTENFLREKGEERPNLAAEWLLCAAAGLKTRTELFMNFNEPLSSSELETMHRAVVRRAQGEPLQYITGETQFRTITVKCAPGVLIPRPETELLVEEVLSYLDAEVLGADGRGSRERSRLPWNAEVERAIEEAKKESEHKVQSSDGALRRMDEVDVFGARAYTDELDKRAEDEGAAGSTTDEATRVSDGATPSPDDAAKAEPQAVVLASSEPSRAKVLEVGCGTGCISLSLAYERPGRVSCCATDIEPRAIELSCRNREALDLTEETVRFILTNLVSRVPKDEWGTFDVLVSNPPYIPSDVMTTLPSEVADHEPALALDGGQDGLDIYRRLVKAAPHMLKRGGLFICELYEGACDAAADLCREAGFEEVHIVRDLTDRPRFVSARIPLDFEVLPVGSR